MGPERNPYAQDRLVTVADLEQFRNELLKEIRYLLCQKQTAPGKQWLKSGEVRKLLQISPGTLQHLRDTGQIPFTKLGGIIYYEYEAIKDILGKQ
ncbi:MAG: helix-turn-helix domain-containing protein [Flavisolibacter sp.]|nr:helix-turn-helix domain-containing protein [Flavisolibacter sp.]MBD0296709.1 helix-turn-helix domain-containing protein [Flavisolibacter sp.]MBD0349883.1 helix-turn-helix domain-containing protein [Flavisolibacter sp.]MBD0367650.1 helix-turn-helix domain-containing protein [Flavisolibacter sp.]